MLVFLCRFIRFCFVVLLLKSASWMMLSLRHGLIFDVIFFLFPPQVEWMNQDVKILSLFISLLLVFESLSWLWLNLPTYGHALSIRNSVSPVPHLNVLIEVLLLFVIYRLSIFCICSLSWSVFSSFLLL